MDGLEQSRYRTVPPPPLPEWYMPRHKEDAESKSSSSSSSSSNDGGLQLMAAPDSHPFPGVLGHEGTKGQLPPTIATSPLVKLPFPMLPTANGLEYCGTNTIPPLAVVHICRICMRPRSHRYHRKHPIPMNGVPPPPGICRRCRFITIEDVPAIDKEMAPRMVRRQRSYTRMGIKSLVPQYDVIPTKTHQKRLDKELSNDQEFDRVYRYESSSSVSSRPISYRYVQRPEKQPSYRIERYYYPSGNDDNPEKFRSAGIDRQSRTTERKTKISATSSSSQAHSAADDMSSKTREHKVKITRSTSSPPARSRSDSSASESVTKVKITSEHHLPKSKCRQRRCEEPAPCRYATAMQEATDSHIRRLARDEVESYRRAERMMASHPDAFSHGRTTSRARESETKRDSAKSLSRENNGSGDKSNTQVGDRVSFEVDVEREARRRSAPKIDREERTRIVSSSGKTPLPTEKSEESKEIRNPYRIVRVTDAVDDEDAALQKQQPSSVKRSGQENESRHATSIRSRRGEESSRASSGQWDTSGSGGTPAPSTSTSKRKQVSGAAGTSADSATISFPRASSDRDTLLESYHSTIRHQPYRTIDIPSGYRIVYPGDSSTASPPDSVVGNPKRADISGATSSGDRTERRERATSSGASTRQTDQRRSRLDNEERAFTVPSRPTRSSRDSMAQVSRTSSQAVRVKEPTSNQGQTSSRRTTPGSQTRRDGDRMRSTAKEAELQDGSPVYFMNGRAPRHMEEEVEELIEWVPSRSDERQHEQERDRRQSPEGRTSGRSSQATDREYMISQRFVDRVDPSGTSRSSRVRYETRPADRLYVLRESAHRGSSRSRPDPNQVQFARLVHVSPTPPGSDASSSAFRSYHSYGRGTTKPVDGNKNSARAAETTQRGRATAREGVDARGRASPQRPRSESPAREDTLRGSGSGSGNESRRQADAHGPYRQEQPSRSVEASAGSSRSQRTHRTESARRGTGSGHSLRQWW